MNNTIVKVKGDFIVLKDPKVMSKFFLYNFEEDEYVTLDDGVTPIPFDNRFDAYRYIQGDEVVHTYEQLPKHIKILLK